MTGTSGIGKTFMDFDTYKNQEWLRRRKLRLEQVRKQSNEISKALRRKLLDDEKARHDEYERMSEANIRDWKAEKLAELERKLRCALEGFGESHRQAEEESELEEIAKEKNQINYAKAQKRGEIAHQEELKKKKMAEEKKYSPILRKQKARKKEDLRSALVCVVPLKKQLLHSKDVSKEEAYSEKVLPKKAKLKKITPHKSCLCKKTPSSGNFPSKGPETVWINLDEIQTCETSDSGLQLRTSKSSTTNGKSQKEKPEGTVEFYDFSSRYHSKTFKEFPHLVKRIDSESEMPNANELAEIEEKNEKEEARKKIGINAVTQERGMEALKREKIQRDYNNLIAKLEELNKKEKILKTQQRNAPRFFHMNDERLSERARNKQRMMDAKFENIYFEATANVPQSEQLLPFVSQGGGDYAQFCDEQPVRNPLKLNTSLMSQEESSLSCPSEERRVRPRRTKMKQQILVDIEKALKEGRKLRETASRKWESEDFPEEEQEETENKYSSTESETSKASVPKDEAKMRSQESQTDQIKEVQIRDEREDLKGLDKAGDESLPVSSATSYKSPPSVIQSNRLRQFLASLDEVIEGDDATQRALQSSAATKKVNKLFYNLLEKQSLNQLGNNQDKSLEYPTLEYYIEKLLSMSRECIANLSVSSENISTPNITDSDVKDEKTSVCTVSSQEENLVRKSTLERANQLEETIKNWKKILEKNSEKAVVDWENMSGSPHSRVLEDEKVGNRLKDEAFTVMCCPSVKSKYEEITKKCSERISELSDLLDKVRRDKEKLLNSTSGGSSLSLNKDERNSEKESVGDEEETAVTEKITDFRDQQKAPPVFESFMNRFNSERAIEEKGSSTAIADSHSIPGPEESFDSWPDVMDELLKKEILTSPFKWSDGECSSEFTKITHNQTKPSSIETVIGNFRKEIKKIKPFSLTESFPQCDSEVQFTPRHSFDEAYLDSFCNRRENFLGLSQRSATDGGLCFQEESSVESINHALTSLGLNWAKSFLRKNEESRAMSSSSNSVEKLSGGEDDSR